MKNLQPLSNRLDAASGSSLASIKTQQLSRESEEKIRLQRVRGTIVLVSQFLLEQGYSQSVQALQQESGLSLAQYAVADNMDLLSMVAEFEEFYEFKYLRKPKLYRTRDSGGGNSNSTVVGDAGERMLTRKNKSSTSRTAASRVPSNPASAPPTYSSIAQEGTGEGPSTPPVHLRPPGSRLAKLPGPAKDSGMLGIEGAPATFAANKSAPLPRGADDDEAEGADAFYGRALKPLPVFPTGELTDLAQTIMREILDVNPAVRWSDIAELEDAKKLLKEAVVMPVKYPQLFEGIIRPWKGILLFGPPGTGKTLLAKAVATECRTTFFNISASSVVSKWRGDSEKLVRMLFDLAVHYSPSTIFIDELDSLMSARSGEGEHEGSRRMKTELLTQMDGLSKRRKGNVVFVLAATNLPWDLDSAILRRLEKKVLVTLPTLSARVTLFRKLLTSYEGANEERVAAGSSDQVDWERCGVLTEGMSGADIDIVCREAVMRPIRLMIERLESTRDLAELERASLKRPCVGMADVEASIACTRSSVRLEDLGRYEKWMSQYGSGMST